MSLSKRHIDVEFRLHAETFDGIDANVVRVAGLRASATIQKTGGLALSQLSLKIYGLTLAIMSRLTTLGKLLPSVSFNTVSVFAYEDGAAPELVFMGNIKYAWADMSAQPEASFNVQAFSGGGDAVALTAASSFSGGVDVAVTMKGFADQMGIAFEPNGVTAQLPPSNFPGSVVNQIDACAHAAQINYMIDDNVLAIWPNGGFRVGDAVTISPVTGGMVNYPMWTQYGISVRAVLNPRVRVGGRIFVESQIKQACGVWNVYSINHMIEAEQPNGQWFTQMECSVIDRPLPLP